MNLGRRIVYDSQTGAIILDTGEQTDATAIITSTGGNINESGLYKLVN